MKVFVSHGDIILDNIYNDDDKNNVAEGQQKRRPELGISHDARKIF